jgi:hypothetical protein
MATWLNMTLATTQFDENTPAGKVLKAAGGYPKLAEMLGLRKPWVWRWAQPKEKGGLDGRIPGMHHGKILYLADLYKWPITANDLISRQKPRTLLK